MSFPPRPRMGMGPPPGMPPRPHFNGPPGFGPHPGMMQQQPRTGMIPMMRPPHMMNHVPPRMLAPQFPPANAHFIAQPPVIKSTLPVTTVFIGNISERAPEDMMKLLLQRCGVVSSWKRVQGASGRLQAFGFCEYEHPTSAMRCIRLCNNLNIGDKKLLVKVDAKTQVLLDEYMLKENKDKSETELIKFDDKMTSDDCNVKSGLESILKENSCTLARMIPKPAPESVLDKDELKKQFSQAYKEDPSQGLRVDKSLDELKLNKDEHNLITHEISFFRNSYKGESKESNANTPTTPSNTNSSSMSSSLTPSSRVRDEKDLLSKPAPDVSDSRRERRRSKSRDRSRERDRGDRGESRRDRDRGDRSDRERRRDRSDRHRSSERRGRGGGGGGGGGGEDNGDDEEDVHERRRLERRMRDKENSYQSILKRWETRERRKMRDYEKEDDKEKKTKQETKVEAARLREFLEDYNDVRDDNKFFKGALLSRRMKDREMELLNDERDRRREKDEINELKNRLISEGKPDCDEELIRIEKETDDHLIKCLVIEDDTVTEIEEVLVEPVKRSKPKRARTPTPEPIEVIADEPMDTEPAVDIFEAQPEPEVNTAAPFFVETKKDVSDSLTIDSTKRKKLLVNDIFSEENEANENGLKRRKLVPLDYNGIKPTKVAGGLQVSAAVIEAVNRSVKEPAQTNEGSLTIEDKRMSIRGLIERIPTSKADLFAFDLDWTMVDQTLMEKRIKPWINKKIIEYIGEEEPSLTEFICTKIMSSSDPQNILNDVSMVLDEEAEVFVVKLWRLLIYESEAKKRGLVKN